MGYDVELQEIDIPSKITPWSVKNPIPDIEASRFAGIPIFKGFEEVSGENVIGGGKALALKTITPTGSYGGGIGVETTTAKAN
jgi:hypothetical protein